MCMKRTLRLLSIIILISLLLYSNQIYAKDYATNDSNGLYVLYEDPEVRGEFEKHFFMSDGSVIAASYSEAVYYKRGDYWVEVDNNLSLINGFYKNKDKDFMISLASNLTDNETVRIDSGEYSISWEPQIVTTDKDNQTAFSEDYEIIINDSSTIKSTFKENNLLISKAFSSITYKNAFDLKSFMLLIRI